MNKAYSVTLPYFLILYTFKFLRATKWQSSAKMLPSPPTLQRTWYVILRLVYGQWNVFREGKTLTEVLIKICRLINNK